VGRWQSGFRSRAACSGRRRGFPAARTRFDGRESDQRAFRVAGLTWVHPLRFLGRTGPRRGAADHAPDAYGGPDAGLFQDSVLADCGALDPPFLLIACRPVVRMAARDRASGSHSPVDRQLKPMVDE
jgi:hypothetical protein